MKPAGAGEEIETSSASCGAGGQVLVVFVISVVTLILLAGLAIDAGNAFLNRRDGQNIADLAALAGTKVVADWYTVPGNSLTSNDVSMAIAARVAANGCGGDDATCSWSASFVNGTQVVLGPIDTPQPSGPYAPIPTGALGVTVHVVRLPRTYFLGVIGQDQWTVQTEATALAGAPGPRAGAVLPITLIPPTDLVYGDSVTLTEASTYGPGNFAWLSWTGDNATKILADSICAPDNPELTLPTPVPGDAGVINSTRVRECLDQWIGAVVYIPVFDHCVDCHGDNAEFNIIGYAAFQLTSYTTSGGAINTLTGSFVRYAEGPLSEEPPSPGGFASVVLVH